MASRRHVGFVLFSVCVFAAGLCLANVQEARAGGRGNAAAAGAAGLAIGLIIGSMAAQQQQEQAGVPNCAAMHGPLAVNAASNPSRCVCKSGYGKVNDGGSWYCAPRGNAAAAPQGQGLTRSINNGGGTQARAEVEKIQESLNLLGYDAGVVDGSIGDKTRQAISKFQADHGFTQTGTLSRGEQDALFKAVDAKRNNVALPGGADLPRASWPPTLDSADPPRASSPPTNHDVAAGKPDPRMELVFWESVKDSKVRAEIEDYIARYPNGQFVKLAELRLLQLARAEEDTRPRVEPRKDKDVQGAGAPKADDAGYPKVDDAGYPKARQRKPDAVAVIIGNSAYKNGLPSVEYGVRDAEAIKLLAMKTLGVEKENVIFLADATIGDMKAVFGDKGNEKGKLWSLIEEGRSDLYVFYSGHGFTGGKDNNETLLLPVDVDTDRANLTAYSLDVLLENLGKLQTKSTTVFLDACFSGQAADAKFSSLIKASPIFAKALPADPAKINLFAAAQPTQLALWDKEAGHGIFTNYVLAGLSGGADEDKNNEVTAKELEEYLRRSVRRAARRTYSKDQEPSFTGKNSGVVLSSF